MKRSNKCYRNNDVIVDMCCILLHVL